MKPTCVAHVLSSFGLGGQERVALDLARTQRQNGQRVLAISLARSPEGPLAACFREHGVEAHTIAKGPGFDPLLPVKIARVLAKQRVEVVHTHNPHALIYGASAASIAGAASVHTKHGMNPDRSRRLWLRRRAAWLLDAYVAVTPTLARVALDDRESTAERLHVVFNGIDTQRFTPDPLARQEIRASLGIPSNAWVVGTVGRLAPEKDQALLMRAMIPMLDERRQLVIVGDGPERASLAELAKSSLRPEYCHQVGARGDVERWLAAFDVFVLSSSTEGLPLGLLEAMATGIPVVSTAVGGIPDLIESGVSGILVRPSDEPELRRQLIYLANYPTAALRLANAGRQRVLARHSLAQMAERYQTIYEQVSSTRPNARPSTERPRLNTERRGVLRVVNQ